MEKFWIAIAFLVGILGTLNHFIYKWLDEPNWVKFFAASNESVFEHLKMTFYPYNIAFIILYLKSELKSNFSTFPLSFLLFCFIVISLFKIYTNLFDVDSILWVDIFIYVIAILLSFTFWYHNKNLTIKYDTPIFIFTWGSILFWMSFCSYNDCKSIYNEH